MPITKFYYKYRSLDNFKFFMDILINQRLYAAKYNELNDIREGIYSHDGSLDKITIDEIKNIKQDIRICSLSTTMHNQPMWAHYANNHTGVVIQLKISDESVQIKPVKYGTIKKNVTKENVTDLHGSAENILLHKENVWKYEKEIRVFKTVTDIEPLAYVKIKILKIIFGKRTPETDKEFLIQILERLDIKYEIVL